MLRNVEVILSFWSVFWGVGMCKSLRTIDRWNGSELASANEECRLNFIG